MATRNLVIGCDGTWYDNESSQPSNIVKILEACLNRNLEKYYIEGVGTAKWEALPGGIYGANLDRQILGAYNFLWKMFKDTSWQREDNRIFIFGFSRGSYAARRLAGLISFAGIPVKNTDRELGWNLYLKRDTTSMAHLKNEGRFFDYPIEFLGVLDTVKTTTDPDYEDHKLPSAVVAGYHAMGLDEKRSLFSILKWNNDPRVHQVWFAGVHSDIGGGYKETALSDITLRWIMASANKHKLPFKAVSLSNLRPDANGTLHESYEGVWLPFGKKVRSVAKTSLVHSSVKERMANGYAPKNLPADPIFVDE